MHVKKNAALPDQIENLPHLPEIVNRVLSVTESPHSSANDVARVLSEDQAVAAKILRVANSSFFGAERKVTQVSRAVVMLGQVSVRNLVIGIAARDAFPSMAEAVPEHTTLWRHAIAVASASEAIARHVGHKPIEEAFVVGLLHDIGQLAMVTFDPESLRALFHEARPGTRFLAQERDVFGVDHTDAGFQILSRWGIPEQMCQVVLRHHEQEINPDDPVGRLLAIVMLADTIAQVMGFGFDIPIGHHRRADVAAQTLGLNDSEQLQILDGLNSRINQAVEMFAEVDAADQAREQASAKRAIWASTERANRASISQLLLEHSGYEVTRLAPADVVDKLLPNDLVIVALPEDNDEHNLVDQLIRKGHQRTVLLCVPQCDDAPRRRDPETGVIRLPRLFTAFDVAWVEEQFAT
ncbi:MAG: HDOD domain-containing protein [Phycisphaerales bacterium]|nr:HDOD domain-containing protein [Phycisphaerales bacterium]